MMVSVRFPGYLGCGVLPSAVRGFGDDLQELELLQRQAVARAQPDVRRNIDARKNIPRKPSRQAAGLTNLFFTP
jgi:hypothetical protein